MGGSWHMMKHERMGLIAVAIMLLALLLASAVSRCSHAPASAGDRNTDSVLTAIRQASADTIATDTVKKSTSKARRQSGKSKNKSSNRQNNSKVTPMQRSHLDEDAR